MIVLDTNVISELMRAQPDLRVMSWLVEFGGEQAMATTVITCTELTYGIRTLAAGRKKSDLTAKFEVLSSRLNKFELDRLAASHAAEFRIMREDSGLDWEDADIYIAGIAHRREAVLATRNIKDFKGLPIETVNPWDHPAAMN